MRRIDKFAFDDFEWDETKRQINVAKSGVDFPDAAQALLEPHLEMSSPKNEEARTKAVCQSDGRIIVVIFTQRGSVCRIISAWPADKNEQRAYRQIFGR